MSSWVCTTETSRRPELPGRIARGEIVVVGSSRLDGGDDALIVLLTAVP